jgi:preprotein translocase subunit SecA
VEVDRGLEEQRDAIAGLLDDRLERPPAAGLVEGFGKQRQRGRDHLRTGIHLRGYGQKDPKIEYKKEGFELFQIMKGRIAASTISMIMRVEPVQQQAPALAQTQRPAEGAISGTLPPLPQRARQRTIERHGEAATADGGGAAAHGSAAPVVRAGPRVGRNDPCPCGSGKKYKKCHLPLEEGGAPAE